jgi:hypothetical protein
MASKNSRTTYDGELRRLRWCTACDGALFTLCLPSGSLVYLLVYVPDVQIASKNTFDVEHVKQLVSQPSKDKT